MRNIGKHVLVALFAMVAMSTAQAGDLQAGWYANIKGLTAFVSTSGGPPWMTSGYFGGPTPGQYGPFIVSNGGYGSLERDVLMPIDAPGADVSQSLVLPVSLSVVGTPIAYLEIAWETNYDPTQMRLEFWRTRLDGLQQLVWYQTRGGPKGGRDDVPYDSTLEGRYFFKVAVAPPEGFPDLSPPDITIQSPASSLIYYKHDAESIPISVVLKDYGTGNSSVDLTLDGQPFAGNIDYTERPGNVLEVVSSIGVASLENGLHTLEVTARDNAGNRASQSVLFCVRSLDAAIVGWGSFVLDTRLGNQASLPPRLANVIAISAGGTHCMALRSDGTVVSWGNLNVGWNAGTLATPQDLNGVIAVSASCMGGLSPPCEHSLALISDGSVVGWGYDYYGAATPPMGLENVVAISAGGQHNLALTSDGTVIGWGQNSSGRATPPPGLANVVGISAGYMHSLALKSDGTVVGWGYDSRHQALPPAGLTNVVAISAGGFHSLALKSDGTVVGWGSNEYGQAHPPEGLANVVAISAGFWHSLALKSDGTMVAWGFNNGENPAPQGLTNVVAVSAGDMYSLVLRDITPPSIDIQSPIAGQTYFNTRGPIPVSFASKDDFDPGPGAMLTLDGQPFSGSEIAASGVAFGDHTLQVTARDKFGNTATRAVTFTVAAEPMPFSIKDLNIDWRHDARKPKADKMRVSGEFTLPSGYTPRGLSQDVIVLIEIGGNSGTDTVLGKVKQRDLRWVYRRAKYELPAGYNIDIRRLRIGWSRKGDKPNRIKLDGDLDAGVFNDGSGIVTVTILLSVDSGGDLAGTETVNCKVHKYSWEYHE